MSSGNGLIWADGAVVDHHAATMSVLAHGVQRGTTVFDVLRVADLEAGPHAFGLRPHVARFLSSMEQMGMDRPYGAAELETAIATTVLANPGDELVKLVAAWAEPASGTLPVSLRPSVWVATTDLPSTVADDRAADDRAACDAPTSAVARAAVARTPKIPAELLPPGLKVAAAYAPGVRELLAARRAGFDAIVHRTANGDLAEGVTQAVFVIRGGRILLPPLDSVLDGITRRAVLEVAHDMGITAEIRPVAWAEVEAADELFFCSTTSPVRPIAVLGERELSAPGPISRQLAHAIDRLLAGEHRLSSRWMTGLEALAGSRAA